MLSLALLHGLQFRLARGSLDLIIHATNRGPTGGRACIHLLAMLHIRRLLAFGFQVGLFLGFIVLLLLLPNFIWLHGLDHAIGVHIHGPFLRTPCGFSGIVLLPLGLIGSGLVSFGLRFLLGFQFF